MKWMRIEKKSMKEKDGKKRTHTPYEMWSINVSMFVCARVPVLPANKTKEEKKHIEIQVNIFLHTYHHRYNVANEQRNDDTSTFDRAIIVLKPKAPRDYNTLG